MNPKPTTIYCLINPITGMVFYIGATCTPLELRLRGHIQKAKNGTEKNEKASHILSILSEGKLPLIEILEECSGYLEPYIAEKWWMYQYEQVLGHELTNSVSKYHFKR